MPGAGQQTAQPQQQQGPPRLDGMGVRRVCAHCAVLCLLIGAIAFLTIGASFVDAYVQSMPLELPGWFRG
eukprot:COSAG04_NODE_530_length_12999_cov_7.702946_6_plen_70_part_00